jgi:hypothetical protein
MGILGKSAYILKNSALPILTFFVFWRILMDGTHQTEDHAQSAAIETMVARGTAASQALSAHGRLGMNSDSQRRS